MSKFGEVVQEGGVAVNIHTYVHTFIYTYIHANHTYIAPLMILRLFRKNCKIQCF